MPPLWFFTDVARVRDPVAVVARLPSGLCGVVFRDADRLSRLKVAGALAKQCRRRGAWLSVADDWRLAAKLGAGLHLRRGRVPPGAPRYLPRLTASAHDAKEARRARMAGAALIFISPVFTTPSHPGRVGIGPQRWLRIARGAKAVSLAASLGGVVGHRIRQLPRSCRAAGAIEAFMQ